MSILKMLLLSGVFCSNSFLAVCRVDDNEWCSTVIHYPVRFEHTNICAELREWSRYLQGFTYNNHYCTGTVSYNQSCDSTRMAQALFGESITQQTSCRRPSFTVSGSSVITRNEDRDFLADYFGLPTDFQSICFLNPSIKSISIDFDYRLYLDDWIEGSYVHIRIPLILDSVWDLGFTEKVINSGFLPYPAGYMSPEVITRDKLLKSATHYFTGAVPDYGKQVSVEPLSVSKMPLKPLHKKGCPVIASILGWNLMREDDYSFACDMRIAIPTGNKPDPEFLFSPLIGTGGHPELGGGACLYVNVWRDKVEVTKAINVYGAFQVTHLFAVSQRRVFDLSNGNSTRYMYVQKMTSLVKDGLRGGTVNACAQFDGLLTPAANISVLNLKVSVPWQASFAVMIHGINNYWDWYVGYDYWNRQPETMTFLDYRGSNRVTKKSWAVKGDAALFGFREDNADAVALSSTQSKADIHGGLNGSIDNPRPAFSSLVNLVVAPGSTVQSLTSLPSKFISLIDIGICKSRTETVTHSLILSVAYTNYDHFQSPYIGFGITVEVRAAGGQDMPCGWCSRINEIGSAPCGSCEDAAQLCAYTRYGVWLSAGCVF